MEMKFFSHSDDTFRQMAEFLDALASLGSAMTLRPSVTHSVRHTSHLT